MNLADLRAELAHRADDSGARPQPDLLPGVEHKVRTTQRNRRVAGSAVVLLALVAVAVGVVPGLSRDGSPDPSRSPGPTEDFVAGGVRFPANLNGAALQKAFVTNPGQTQATFVWTPAADGLTTVGVCRAEQGADVKLRVSIEGVTVSDDSCTGGTELGGTSTMDEASGLWTVAGPDRPATVTLRLETPDGKLVGDPTAVLGLGLYTPAPASADPMPHRTPPASPNDYTNDGFRYRTVIGDATLVKAMIGELGQRTVTFGFIPATNRLRITPFCLGGEPLWVKASINGSEQSTMQLCGLENRALGEGGYAAGEPGAGWPGVRVGKPNTITVRLTDKAGKPVSGLARIGVGIYQEGEKEVVTQGAERVEVPKVIEYRGYNYRLTRVRSGDAKTDASLSILTPAGVPFLVYYGVTATGDAKGALQLDGVDDASGISLELGGFGTIGQPARVAGEATLRVADGSPTKGTLVVGVYEPIG